MSERVTKTVDSSKGSDTADQGERLRRLRRLGVRRGRAGLAPRSLQVGEAATLGEQDEAPQPIEQLVGGQEVFTPAGPCVVAETRYPLSEARGGWPLAAVLTVSDLAVASCARDDSLAGFDFRQAAFIDTETSGLAGGAGTIAFQVGLGTFEPDAGGDPSYVVRQVFMRNPAEEGALLHVVTTVLARCTGLVSFNGRAFDVPLLENRFVMQHEPSPLQGLPHLDLLPPARRRWRQRLPSCALGALEQDVLNFRRSEDDVPGWLIPTLYQQYTRGGDSAPMARVFYHNRQDIVSMVPLAAILCVPFENRGQDLDSQMVSHPLDLLSLGRCYEELGWLDVSESSDRQALAAALEPAARAQAPHRSGWLRKRQERRAESQSVGPDWFTRVPGAEPATYVEVANARAAARSR